MCYVLFIKVVGFGNIFHNKGVCQIPNKSLKGKGILASVLKSLNRVNRMGTSLVEMVYI